MWPQKLLLLAYAGRIVTALDFSLTNFQGAIAEDTGTLRSLRPATDTSFDFMPNDVWDSLNGVSNHHLGDVALKYRADGQTAWTELSTVANRSITPEALPVNGSAIASSNLSAVFSLSGLQVTRTWSDNNGDLVLSFDITNSASASVEMGGLEFPIQVNNVLTNRAAPDARDTCSFVDPYIGLNAGYAQVTRLTGQGPNMVITPTTPGTKLEAWRFQEERTDTPLAYKSTSYEGTYAWVVHSQAYKDDWWGDVDPWNVPTTHVIEAGATVSFGLRFTIAPSVTDIESTVAGLGHPVAVGLPGYVLQRDVIGSLYLESSFDDPDITVEPEGALNIQPMANSPSNRAGYTVTPGDGSFGRVRVTIIYSADTRQTVHYWIADETKTALDKIGQFISDRAWYTDESDPFGRAPSIMSWDNARNELVLQSARTYIAGLSDEGGTGAYMSLAIKQLLRPVADEVSKLEEFANGTLWGTIQHIDTPEYGVKRSIFYYQPDAQPNYNYDPSIDWSSAWNKAYSDQTERTYNYVWVSALYWVLYRVSFAAPGMITYHEPSWYLEQAFETVNFAFGKDSSGNPITGYTKVGLMGESLWGDLITDLINEGMTDKADILTGMMRERQTYWAQQDDPYGSEQPWDCTGQEAVYFWSRYFGDEATCDKTINSIHGFDPTIAHWGYNGNARRYWDFIFAGSDQTARIERQIHHYGSPLNAIPLLDEYRHSSTPNDATSFYNLRVGFGGHSGTMSNIDPNGFPSMAFHSYADTLEWDTYTGDVGPSIVGHYLSASSYLVQHPEFGWVVFGGNIISQSEDITVEPKDTVRRRVFFAPLGLYVNFDASQIKSYTWSESQGMFKVTISPDGDIAQTTTMGFDQTSSVVPKGSVKLVTDLKPSRGGYAVSIPAGGTTTLQWQYTA